MIVDHNRTKLEYLYEKGVAYPDIIEVDGVTGCGKTTFLSMMDRLDRFKSIKIKSPLPARALMNSHPVAGVCTLMYKRRRLLQERLDAKIADGNTVLLTDRSCADNVFWNSIWKILATYPHFLDATPRDVEAVDVDALVEATSYTLSLVSGQNVVLVFVDSNLPRVHERMLRRARSQSDLRRLDDGGRNIYVNVQNRVYLDVIKAHNTYLVVDMAWFDGDMQRAQEATRRFIETILLRKIPTVDVGTVPGLLGTPMKHLRDVLPASSVALNTVVKYEKETFLTRHAYKNDVPTTTRDD